MPKKKHKTIPHDAIVVNREAFLSALHLTSVVIQALGDEYESLRTAKLMNPDMRNTLMQVIGVHLRNVSSVSAAFQASLFDPIDPDNTKGKRVN